MDNCMLLRWHGAILVNYVNKIIPIVRFPLFIIGPKLCFKIIFHRIFATICVCFLIMTYAQEIVNAHIILFVALSTWTSDWKHLLIIPRKNTTKWRVQYFEFFSQYLSSSLYSRLLGLKILFHSSRRGNSFVFDMSGMGSPERTMWYSERVITE